MLVWLWLRNKQEAGFSAPAPTNRSAHRTTAQNRNSYRFIDAQLCRYLDAAAIVREIQNPDVDNLVIWPNEKSSQFDQATSRPCGEANRLRADSRGDGHLTLDKSQGSAARKLPADLRRGNSMRSTL
jgi:hypothetical protein